LDEFKFTPEKQALQAQHISISGPTGAGEKSTQLAERRYWELLGITPTQFRSSLNSSHKPARWANDGFRPLSVIENLLILESLKVEEKIIGNGHSAINFW